LKEECCSKITFNLNTALDGYEGDCCSGITLCYSEEKESLE